MVCWYFVKGEMFVWFGGKSCSGMNINQDLCSRFKLCLFSSFVLVWTYHLGEESWCLFLVQNQLLILLNWVKVGDNPREVK